MTPLLIGSSGRHSIPVFRKENIYQVSAVSNSTVYKIAANTFQKCSSVNTVSPVSHAVKATRQ